MRCFFGEKKKKKFVQLDKPMDDFETIMALSRLDGEVNHLIQHYPEDHPLMQQYRELPRKGCSRDPEKFKQFQVGLQDIFQKIQADMALNASSLPVSKSLSNQ